MEENSDSKKKFQYYILDSMKYPFCLLISIKWDIR